MNYRVIKNNDIFLITDQAANVVEAEHDQNGLYYRDSRYLSRYNLLLNGRELIVLKSKTKNSFLNETLMTNSESDQLDEAKLLLRRKETLLNKTFYDNLNIKNHDHKLHKVKLEVEIDADFLDIFEVRKYYKNNLKRKKVAKNINDKSIKFIYQGLDGIERSIKIISESEFCVFEENRIKFEFELEAGEEKEFTIAIQIDESSEKNGIYDDFIKIEKELENEHLKWNQNSLQITSDNPKFNQFMERSSLDLQMLSTDVGYGEVPIAGIPWYAVPFGRDSIITSLQTLIFNPALSKATLKTLASYQGQEINPEREEEPGKIFHELRFGELANLNKIPHTPYYGTVDATPLFIVLAGEYYRWTGDLDFIKELLPNLESALNWIDKYGDQDGDLFVEFNSKTKDFTINQGWKDSVDSSINSQGKIAEAPIALAEVQAYVYQAKLEMAEIYQELMEKEKAELLKKQALELKNKFNQQFWDQEKEIFVLGLDKNKKQIDSLTTNPAHGFYSGIIDDKKGQIFLEKLLGDKLNSGIGLRTMSAADLGYNPVSYHNGSIWPHDNSLIIEGLKRYGYQAESNQLITDIFKAAQDFEYYRLPELYCGFGVKEESEVVKYPTSCSPQAWAAGSAYLFLHSMLGLQVDARKNKVLINSKLPEWINQIEIRNLQLGDKKLAFKLEKDDEGNKLKEISVPDELKIEVKNNKRKSL